MYIPNKSRNLKNQSVTKIRLGLQGEPGAGKSTSALTFPNPLVLNFDEGLSGHLGKDIVEIPLWDYTWVSEYGYPPSKPEKSKIPNQKDCLIRWFEVEALKLEADQTLILDSWTSMQNAFDHEQSLHEVRTKSTGEVNDFDFWVKKIEYSEKVIGWIRAVRCNVIVTFHEAHVRDPKSGQLMKKIDPLMQGGFLKQLKSHFPNWFRQVNETEKDSQGKPTKTNWYWQIKSNEEFDAKCQYVTPDSLFKIKANYNELVKLESKSTI